MLSGCVRNITAFCQLLLRPIISAVLADTDILVKPKYRSISSFYMLRRQRIPDDACFHYRDSVKTLQKLGKVITHVCRRFAKKLCRSPIVRRVADTVMLFRCFGYRERKEKMSTKKIRKTRILIYSF